MQVYADAVVPGDDYLIDDNAITTYIYSKEYTPMIKGLKTYETKVLDALSKEYGYTFDETLYVMLASRNNQITNASSTQIPFNAQLHYGAGAGGGGLSGTIGWMKMLLIHETAHNFQLNAKENPLSGVAHDIFGASFLTVLGVIPLFPLPNYYLGRFLLEGNAVLNESRFGLGGRLYSSAIIAQNVVLARAGKLTPERVYNNILEYPYTSQFYHVGGLFQAYLAERYGVEKVNGFYKEHSKHYLPLMINSSFKSYFGEDLETHIDTFVHKLLDKHKDFQKSHGEKILHAESAVRMQRNGGIIDIMSSDFRSAPLHLQLKNDATVLAKESTTYPMGSIFRVEGKDYVQSTESVSSKRIVKGLYDEEAKLLAKSDSKIVQGVMPDGRLVYVNVDDSYERWHLHVGNTFYSVIDSEALVMPTGDLYYFKQKGKMRTAYKNHQVLFSYEGYYGIVCDVDSKGRLYFIASSKDGSALYRYSAKGIERVGKGDDIIDMKLLEDENVLVSTVDAEGVTYLKQKIEVSTASIPSIHYTFKNIVENDMQIDSFTNVSHDNNKIKNVKEYHPMKELRYSTFIPRLGYNSDDGLIAGGVVQLTDPLGYNTLDIPFHIENDYKMLGAVYENSSEVLTYRLGVFGIFDANKTLGYRDYGLTASVTYPFWEEGYETATATLRYDEPYDKETQKPISLLLHWDESKQYGFSMYPNDAQSIDVSLVGDRGTSTLGLGYTFWHDFGNESYVRVNAEYFKSSDYNTTEERGITIARRKNDYAYNPATLEIYGLQNDTFVDEAIKAELGLYKVFNFSKYFFSFPLSLQRESLYAKARYYRLGQEGTHNDYTEFVLGSQIDVLLYHELSIPLTMEWIHNENAYEKESVRFGFGFSF
jgi:hypothetical protein